ncbi:hypothetical protein J4E82_001604 [Alternaria postmessia]|uniref:uncharacterized protein n=1 Tax=Alternaria postmessia TaxID=1187938 RepID=UPI0010DA1151|nr:uncharacterized protein J4E82_001604 [Alternaria postmessia]KAI5379565.1 hypothetical protein J4E82_001604 [Alternaria postmessia]RYN90521.1 hypothetical protein AA0120_g6041 [Alternaria tenuissima]
MVAQTSKPSSRSSSVTAPVENSSLSQHHAIATSSSLRAALKKPFQGWSKELLRARDDDDDDYNFSSDRYYYESLPDDFGPDIDAHTPSSYGNFSFGSNGERCENDGG